MDLLQHLLLRTAAHPPQLYCRRCNRHRQLLPGKRMHIVITQDEMLTASRGGPAFVQVAGATRIMEMRQSRSGSHLLLSCQDRSIKLLELTPAVQLLEQPSFTLAQAQQKLAAAKVGAP